MAEQCNVTTTGAKENKALPRNAVNLIYRAMSFAAQHEGATLPPVELLVDNEIPLASGLGSSGAAIVAGIKLGGLLLASKSQINPFKTTLRNLKDIRTTSPPRCTGVLSPVLFAATAA